MGRINDSTNSPISLVGGISGRKSHFASSPSRGIGELESHSPLIPPMGNYYNSYRTKARQKVIHLPGFVLDVECYKFQHLSPVNGVFLEQDYADREAFEVGSEICFQYATGAVFGVDGDGFPSQCGLQIYGYWALVNVLVHILNFLPVVYVARLCAGVCVEVEYGGESGTEVSGEIVAVLDWNREAEHLYARELRVNPISVRLEGDIASIVRREARAAGHAVVFPVYSETDAYCILVVRAVAINVY